MLSGTTWPPLTLDKDNYFGSSHHTVRPALLGSIHSLTLWLQTLLSLKRETPALYLYMLINHFKVCINERESCWVPTPDACLLVHLSLWLPKSF